ncbi:unnamed protein product [Rhizophagus irregularis]|nr:unnamed protein product [Rhizophagus irregularis]
MAPIYPKKTQRTCTAISIDLKKEICEYMVANPNFPELDMAMQIWTSQAVTSGVPLTDGILQQKGLELAEMLNVEDQLKCANGWVYRFKLRNGLQKVHVLGKAKSAPLESLSKERIRLRALLAKYNEEDIYNADETGLFFRMEPNQTLSTGAVSGPISTILQHEISSDLTNLFIYFIIGDFFEE